MIDFTEVFQLKCLKSKNKGHTNFYDCCDLTKKVYLLYLLLTFSFFLSNIGSLFIYMQTIQHSQVLLYVLTTTGSLYSSQKSTTNNIQLIAQYKQKTTLDHSNSLLRIYDLTLAADFLLYTDRERRKSWKVIIYHVRPNNCGCASDLSTTTTIYQMTQSLMTGLMRILQMRLLISTWCRDLEVGHSISLDTMNTNL